MELEKAVITNTVTSDKIPVMFNPEEYTLNKDVNYAQASVPGLSAPILQFVNGNLQTLEMELLLDTYESHTRNLKVINRSGEDVRQLTRKISGLMDIDPGTHAPPVLIFTWGSLSFTCVLARVQQRFTLFNSGGLPVRAKLQVTFNEFRNSELEAKEIKRETADFTRTTVVGQGETLSGVAFRVYGDAALWRPLALRNDVADPRRLPIGLRLAIPPLPFRDPETGEVYH